MATGGQLTILNPDDQTNLDFPPTSPTVGNTAVSGNNEKILTHDQLTQTALHSLHDLLTRPDTTGAKKDWAHGKMQIIIAKLCDRESDIESANSDTNDITEKLKQKDLALREKDNEILRLKAELNKQQKESQEQRTQMALQKQAEISTLQNQIQQLQQHQYVANMLTNGPSGLPNTTYPTSTVPPHQSSLNSSLIQELSYSLNMQNQINRQHHLNMAPSYDGKDPKQVYTWLDDVERLSNQYTMTRTEVAQITSRGSVHKYIQELKLQNYAWDVIKVKLRERFSDCTSTAAAQNKLSSLKQNGRSMHEYIAHFSDLLEHAHSKKATDVGTNLLANQFIEGIDDTNKFTKNKLREKSGNNLDYYFQEAMRLQHKQEIRAIDYEPNLHTQVSECTDINALRSNNLTCFNCKSPDHFAKDCPEPNKMQQPQSNNRQNISKESVIEACSQILERFLSNQNPHGYSKPKQPFHHNKANPHAKPSFKPTYRPHDNKGHYFKDNSKYQKQTTHTNAIEDYEPQYEVDCCTEQEDLIPFDPSEDQTKN